MKFNPLSVARARAIMVLLQPGGPYNSTPRGGAMPSRAKACGDQTGVRKLLASASCISPWSQERKPPNMI